ncbi:hypothetical protein [Streptomyces sp. NPDC051776]|uniref:hypothetical protein n=1 Tax=Streptomyces sp. NPDC051776 TaxID=3155414 RepID=UPI0034422CB6
MRQLLGLREAGELKTAHVRLVAESVGVSVRQVWRWLAQAEETGNPEKPERRRFRITDEIVEVLADHQGNVKRAHEHLVRVAKKAGEKPVGLTTLHDAIARDLDPGFMAGLREGIPAARGFDPAFRRPAVARNQVWEGDHKQAPTVVMMPDKKLSKAWVTWFEDRGTSNVMGWAVTAGSAHRGSVLAAVRASVLREDPYGPAGGAAGACTGRRRRRLPVQDGAAGLRAARCSCAPGTQRPSQRRYRAAEPHQHDPFLRRPAPLHQGAPA